MVPDYFFGQNIFMDSKFQKLLGLARHQLIGHYVYKLPAVKKLNTFFCVEKARFEISSAKSPFLTMHKELKKNFLTFSLAAIN
jgi:hypothetical protein